MRIEKATRQLLNTEIIRQIIPSQYMDLLLQRLSEGALMNLIVCDEVPVGFVTLIDVKTGELMTVMHQDYRRKGFVFQACIKTINESFEEFDLKEIMVKTQNKSASFY